LPFLLESVGEASSPEVLHGVGQLFDPLAEVPHVELAGDTWQLVGALTESPLVQPARVLGQLLQSLAESAEVQARFGHRLGHDNLLGALRTVGECIAVRYRTTI
jgi:hypothetical protein